MHFHTNEILLKNGFHLSTGEWHNLTSAISFTEAKFLEQIIKENSPVNCLEIGCAEGISSMVICDAIGVNSKHTILDPNQGTQWKSMGIANLQACNFENFSLIQEYSEFALPELLKSKKSFDFIFVDGWHTFDHVLLEFFYINRLLTVGGIVAFDDAALIPLNRVMRYITNYSNFKLIGSAGEFYESRKRKWLDNLKQLVNVLTIPLGKRLRQEILNDSVVRSSQSLGIDGSITAFQKIANDDRGWAWYKSF